MPFHCLPKNRLRRKGRGVEKTPVGKTAPVVVLNDTAKAAPSALGQKSARNSGKPSTPLWTHRARDGVKALISSLADEMDLYERGVYELAIYTVIEQYGSAELKARCDQWLPDSEDFDGCDSAKALTDGGDASGHWLCRYGDPADWQGHTWDPDRKHSPDEKILIAGVG